MIKVLIADDQLLFRESLKILVEQDQEIEVIGCVGNGAEAAKTCDQLTPDVVLMDILMPVCDGVDGTRLIKEKHPSVKIMILTTFDDASNIAMALKNGAEAYVLKDVKPEALILAIKSLAKGMPVIHEKAFSKVLKQLNMKMEATAATEARPTYELTEREIRIIRLIVDGKTNKEIATCINFTEGSVKNVITAILEKLKLKDRTQLAVFAVKNNLV